MDDVSRVGLPVEAPACLRDAVLAVHAARDDALLSRGVNGVRVAAALGGGRLERVEGARGLEVAAPHLQLHFAQSGRVATVCALQDYRAEAQVFANNRRALPGFQRRGDATAHGGRHARGALVYKHELSHCVSCV